jgi:hypothetical protein
MTANSKPVVRRTLSAAEMHRRVMAGAAHEAATSSANEVRILKVERDFKGITVKPKVERAGGIKVTAQRVGTEVTSEGQPRAKGPLPVGLLLPGTYSADEYQIMIRDAGRRQIVEAGTNIPQFYPNGSPKMMVDPMARVVDEIKAISGFCGYLLPHMEGSKEAGPHGAQLANANRQAYRLASTGRGAGRMSHGSFPLPAEAATTKAHTRSSAAVAGYIHGMPDADRKLVLDYLKREELAAFNFRMHEAAAEDALAKLEADLDGADADELDKLIAHHETQREVERQRLVEIRRVLASKGVNIAPTLLERDIAEEGALEMSAPSGNGAKTECAGCEDENCPICFEEVEDDAEIIQNFKPTLPTPKQWVAEVSASQGVSPDVAREILESSPESCPPTVKDPSSQVPYTVDDDGCIVEKPLSIEEQIAALKAANAALRGETPVAPKGFATRKEAAADFAKGGKAVEVKPVIDIDALQSDEDLANALDAL